MSFWRYITRSLRFHWRINLAVALGVMAATAVLTGALLVGDSVRGSLRRLTIERLGRIDLALITDRFFREDLATELAASEKFQQHFTAAAPVILLPQCTVEKQEGEGDRASSVTVIAADERFWSFAGAAGRPKTLPAADQIVLNQPLARELGWPERLKVGDEISLWLPNANQVPADSPLGRKTGRAEQFANYELIEVVPPAGLGRFDLQPNQQMPRNAYLSLSALQFDMGQENKVNAILVGDADADAAPSSAALAALDEALQPRLTDYGVNVERVTMTFSPPEADEPVTAFEYFSVTTERMLFHDDVAASVARSLEPHNPQPVLTYLANEIAKAPPPLPAHARQVAGAAASLHSGAALSAAAAAGTADEIIQRRPIPYSLVTAVDSNTALGPLLDDQGRPLKLDDDEIVLTDWAARELGAKVGDRIVITYFEPDDSHGRGAQGEAAFRVRSIIPLTEPAREYRGNRPATYRERPTRANDPHLTPTVAGLTDQEGIDGWKRWFGDRFNEDWIFAQDRKYWDNYRTTPKAYVSLAAGRKLWGSRFGRVTSFRVPAAAGLTAEKLSRDIRAGLERDNLSLGMEFIPVKQQGLRAASGTTPFNLLFLGFSFFIIAAALMLVSLLFRLGVEQRATEIGILLATGVPRGRTGRLLAGEGAIVAALGGLLGIALGVGYAWLMIFGLTTWWVEAIATPFLELHVTWQSLVIGYGCGVLAALATIAWTLFRMRKTPPRRLLAGQAAAQSEVLRRRRPVATATAWMLLAVAVGLAILATRLSGEAQAGAFFGGGAAVLAAAVMFVWLALRLGGIGKPTGDFGWPLAGLASRNAARNPQRSTLSVALVATASFLIVAISAFQLRPTEEGTGGFALYAQSNEPIFADLDDPSARAKLLGDQAAALQDATILRMRVKAGEDASCRNLYQTRQPRVLGVSAEMIDYFDDPPGPSFAFAGSAADSPEERANPWRVLQRPVAVGEPVPVIIDKNTAAYSLHLSGVGDTFTVPREGGGEIKYRVAGLLSNSILQGSLLVGEEHFSRLYPEAAGYRYFLIRGPDDRLKGVAGALEKGLTAEGFDVKSSRALLRDLLAVQNTYLQTFQSLGALGLLLGTLGLATVQLRNVLERRGELALLRAAGFRRRRLAGMVLLENSVLLLTGLAVGVFAALVAVVPHMLSGGAAAPLDDLAAMLGIVLAVGVVTGLFAARATLKAPLVAALRGD